jgi:hypothetical protein
MDFNTGRGSGGPSRGSDDSSSPLFGGGQTNPSRPPVGPSARGTGGEFNLSDPVNSFVRIIRALIANPVGFFRALPPRGGFIRPLAFAAVCSVLAAIPFLILFVLLSLLAADITVVLAALFSSLIFFIVFPVGTIISAFVNAAIYHLVLYLLVRNNNAGFEATLRVLCYASFPVTLAFLFLIPILNILVALALSVYVIFLFVLGIREMHRLTTGQAAIVVLAPFGVAVVFSLILGGFGLVIGGLAGSI